MVGHVTFLWQGIKGMHLKQLISRIHHLFSLIYGYSQFHSDLCIYKNWKPVKGSEENSEDPDQMPHNVASEQGLHCLLTGFFIKSTIKATK